MAEQFWVRWRKEYLVDLQRRQMWKRPRRNLSKGDVVLLIDDNDSRCSWPMGLVTGAERGSRGLTRAVEVRTKNGLFKRPISKLILLLESD
jgi:hypothetical protein